MGGVWTDTKGRTSIEGLWAVGEVASTGVHGANRLASNSLLEAVVFGARIANAISVSGAVTSDDASDDGIRSDDMDLERILRQTMTDHVGVVRDAEGLQTAIATIQKIEQEAQSLRLRSMALAALFIANGALQRQESRGGHYRSDFSNTNSALATRHAVTLNELNIQLRNVGRS